VPLARQVLFHAGTRSLNPEEQKFMKKLLRLLDGHPLHQQTAWLFAKAKVGPLKRVYMMDLRVMAGNGQPDEEMDVVDENTTMDEDEEGDKQDTRLMTTMITDLGANATGAGLILTKIAMKAHTTVYVSGLFLSVHPADR
jgi:hypothetical protein